MPMFGADLNGPKLKDLWIMPSQDVSLVIDDVGLLGTKDKLWYQYNQ
jgi:hypothetical protein